LCKPHPVPPQEDDDDDEAFNEDDITTIDSKASASSRDPFLTPGTRRLPSRGRSTLSRVAAVGDLGAAEGVVGGASGTGRVVSPGVIGPNALDFEFGEQEVPKGIHHAAGASVTSTVAGGAPGPQPPGSDGGGMLSPQRHHAAEVVFQADVDKIIRLPRLIQRWSRALINHKLFNRFIFVVIILNSIVLGLDEPSLSKTSHRYEVTKTISTWCCHRALSVFATCGCQ
jgi:hypothetical protein